MVFNSGGTLNVVYLQEINTHLCVENTHGSAHRNQWPTGVHGLGLRVCLTSAPPLDLI